MIAPSAKRARAAQAFIGLGSNLDDPLKQVRQAVVELNALPDCCVVARSRFYRTEPVGPPGQPDYANAVVQLETEQSPGALLTALQQLEYARGRERGGERWGPRPLDMDILLYGPEVIATARLTVPHPRISERAFVLVPLAELAPDLVIPGHGTVRGIRNRVGDWGVRVWTD
ncbi:MAG: 2-amino-4-hydroxy-6-hydroxymethyldihydropteridine diphosphokinase [Pseudomonadota bacterium]|nr:2-amino-4-hydroxy-6-hydroxymethyldihydropteridine diphosphokinase [Pseudomonadota bacterium]